MPLIRPTPAMQPLPVLDAPGFGLRAAEQRRGALWRQVVGELSTPQYAVLVSLMAEPGLDHIRVSERISADKATITEVVRALVSRGLVGTEADERDARRRVLSLMPQGAAEVVRVAGLVGTVDRFLLEPLVEAARTEILRLWTQVADGGGRLGITGWASTLTALPADVRDSLTHSGFALRRARQVHARLWEGIVGAEVTPGRYALLDVLHHDEPLDLGTLARLASVEQTTAVRMLRRLTESGDVDREPDTRDRRRVVLRLTPGGRELLLAHTPAVNEVQDALMAPLSTAERRRFAMLSAVVAGLVGVDGTSFT